MRITQNMMNNSMLNNLRNNYAQMDRYMEQLSTGKKINRPSDDPIVAMRGIDYRSELTKVKQYERNMSELHNWMDTSDESLNQAGQALNRVREIMVQASNDTYEENQRGNMAKEVNEIRNHLIDLANTKVNNKYIFNGTNTTEPRFSKEGELLEDPKNDNGVMIEVSEGIQIRANINPSNAFSEELFDELNNIVSDLENPDASGDDFDEYLTIIDDQMNELLNERADLGARMNRVDLIENRLSQQEISTSKIMSENEDAHMEEVIMHLKMQESIYRASLAGGARIIQPSLLDFLR
ncbi:flagellar hook-associated protein FlgL [Piscibacillus halophilus]|uniref:Flagellar hook-associated protein 3 FlgL n=1 Tax=Piscibacillus halophilus TaxID=571933 RepID=A0A1H9EI74_9BACI|nr:flagellar hook-associated protein FlgL [Piscibacillus halophilus]SEQ25315.1 flagellar hook-associated protein 3 FlgL [Piscibacillus halophilus]